MVNKNKMNENSSRRRWSGSETNLLVDLVKKHYDFLTSACNPKKSRTMVENKWAEITEAVNALGGGTAKLTSEQIQKKWSDLKSTSKKAVCKYKAEMSKTGGGVSKGREPTELQFKIASFIGKSYTEGIPGTEISDTTLQSETSVVLYEDVSEAEVSHTDSSVSNAELQNDEPVYKAKRPKLCKRDAQNEEILQAEKRIVEAVIDMKKEMEKTNVLIADAVVELKRSNNIQERLVTALLNRSDNQGPHNASEVSYIRLLNLD